ncbi:MAG: hypothetical protein LBR81_08930 [Prevotellaceae bacterium]|jgi:hypothetical protein|nr:hypothetical protein [Prevotellaceae bacterium]
MEAEDAYKTFQQMMEHIPGRLHLLEKPISLEAQSAYFMLSQQIRKSVDKEKTLASIPDLFDTDADHEHKKTLLLSLASLDEVEAYRAIEKYAEAPDEYLSEWAAIALNESRMNIEHALLGESQVFISTGLGGKDQKLRFFMAFFSSSNTGFSEFQKEIAHKEFEYAMTNNDCEVESFEMQPLYFTAVVLIPFVVDFRKVISSFLSEINQYGNFLREHLLITNVKIFNEEEIRDFMRKNSVGGAEAEAANA